MAKEKQENIRKQIGKDLRSQLSDKQIVGKHYEDMVQDYLALWDLKCKLIDDIEQNGVKVKGAHGPKSNSAVSDLHKTNERMIKTLDALGLKASPSDTQNENNKYTAADLM